jgi:uncharacterized protein (TIGR02145 family)
MKKILIPVLVIISTFWILLTNNCKKYYLTEVWIDSTSNLPPSVPINPKPNDKAINITDTVLSWDACTDPEGDKVNYLVYFGMGKNNLEQIVEISQTQIDFTKGLFPTLSNYTTYYWQILADSPYDGGSNFTYGNIWSFTTGMICNPKPKSDSICFNKNLKYDTLIDSRDGKKYLSIKIGNQIWMAQNLDYRTPYGSWYYQNDSVQFSIYGRLYYWEIAMNGALSSKNVPSGVHGICPYGWHLPSIQEWTILNDYLGFDASDKLEETGELHWESSYNKNATNESGFTALPSGYRDFSGEFSRIDGQSLFWSSTGYDDYKISCLVINLFVEFENVDKGNALCVRCIKDN